MKWSISNHKGLIIGLLGLFLSFAAYANPVIDRVTAGSATIDQTPGRTQINQSSGKAIIHWRSFNINKEEATHFQQPQGGVALNRIDANQGASQIFGVLTATGKIILVNQAGIYFGPTARVDVGGIIASTSDILDSNFLAGKYIFDQPSTTGGSIVNEGSIVARQHGLVALAGNAVQNDGTIRANLGRVVLASGNKFTVDLAGDELINFTVDEEITRGGVHPGNGSAMQHAVSNTGSVIANGGKIIMTAQAARGVLDNVINMSGVAQAKSVRMQRGEIILSANTGKVTVSGKLITTARSKKQSGGTIKVLGERVHIKAPAVLDASGGAGGGTILIGGNYQGKGPEYNAKATYIEKGAFVKADALWNGDGGEIIAWADDATWVYGSLSAMGGPLGGNGGLIETSGKNYLDVAGIRVNTLAPNGKTGIWLLDPTNIYIAVNQASATAAGMSGSDTSANTGTGGNPNTFEASGAVQDSLLTTGTLTSALTTADVIVSTTNPAGAGLGDINVVDPISWASSNGLTLTAANNVNIAADITSNSNGNFTVNAGGAINVSNNLTIGAGATANFTSSGSQTYNGLVTLGTGSTANFNISTGGTGNIAFSNSEALTGAGTVTFDTPVSPNFVTFSGNIGITTPLASLTMGGGRVLFANGDRTVKANSQTYNNLIELDAATQNVILSTGPISTGTGAISINNAIITDALNQTLTLMTGNGNGDHNFTLNSGTIGVVAFPLTLAITGSNGSGVDTFTLQTSSTSQTWGVDNNKSGSITVSGASYFFANFDFSELENLIGSTNNDTFAFTGSGAISSINGGPGGTNFLDLSGLSSDNAMTITQGSVVGFQGTSSVGLSSFNNITDLTSTSGSNNSLQNSIAPPTRWLINSVNGGVFSDNPVSISLNFSNIQTLIGSLDTNENFIFTSGGSVSAIQGNIGISGTKTLDFSDPSIAAQNLSITLSAGSPSLGYDGTSNFGVSSFTEINQIKGTTSGSNSLTGPNASPTWSIGGSNGGSITDSGRTLTFTDFGTLTGGSAADNFILNGGSLSGPLNGGGGSNTLTGFSTGNTWSITANNAGSVAGLAGGFTNIQNLVGGAGGDTFNLSSGVSLTSVTGNSGATNTINFLTTPVVLEFSSTRNGVAKTTMGATLVTFANMDNSTGEGGGTAQLPTTTVNTLTMQSNGNASFSDPFNFVNTNNGYTTFILNPTDSVTFSGFPLTFTLTKVSSTIYTAQINGATYTFSGVDLNPTPPSPTPDRFVPNYEIIIRGTTTPESKNVLVDTSGIGSLAGFLIGNVIVDQMINSIQDSLVLQQKDIKVNLNCGS